MFYSLIFLLLFFFASFDVGRRLTTKLRYYSVLFLFLVFWLIAGLRYETGVDWPGYTLFYKNMDSFVMIFTGNFDFLKDKEFEIGFVLLNSFLKMITDDIQLMFLLIALFTNILLFSSLKIYSKHIFISLMIYFSTLYFVMDMDVIRQCISATIFFYSLIYIANRNIYKFSLAIIIAGSFHQTALLLFPLYYILNKDFKNKYLLVFVGIAFSVFAFQIPWLQFIINHIIGIISPGSFQLKLSSYSNVNISRNFGIGLIGNLLIFIFCLLKRNKLKINNMYNLFLNLFIINLIIYYSTWELSMLSSRIRLYFLMSNIVLLTYFIDVFEERLKKYFIFMFISLYCLFYGRIYFFESPEGISYNPYQNYAVYKIFGLKSTGPERLTKFFNYIDKQQ